MPRILRKRPSDVGAAARICDDNGRASYAIGISGPSNRVVPTRMPQLAVAVQEACREVRQACRFTDGRAAQGPGGWESWAILETDVGDAEGADGRGLSRH